MDGTGCLLSLAATCKHVGWKRKRRIAYEGRIDTRQILVQDAIIDLIASHNAISSISQIPVSFFLLFWHNLSIYIAARCVSWSQEHPAIIYNNGNNTPCLLKRITPALSDTSQRTSHNDEDMSTSVAMLLLLLLLLLLYKRVLLPLFGVRRPVGLPDEEADALLPFCECLPFLPPPIRPVWAMELSWNALNRIQRNGKWEAIRRWSHIYACISQRQSWCSRCSERSIRSTIYTARLNKYSHIIILQHSSASTWQLTNLLCPHVSLVRIAAHEEPGLWVFRSKNLHYLKYRTW